MKHKTFKRERRTLKELLTPTEFAHEAYAVLMQEQGAGRTVPKDLLRAKLKQRDVYTEFLKLSMDYDRTDDLAVFRKALSVVVKCIGPSLVTRKSGINRITLYRMLRKGGNPGIKTLIALLKALNLGLWVVDSEFYGYRDWARRKSARSD